jgi:acetyl esterase
MSRAMSLQRFVVWGLSVGCAVLALPRIADAEPAPPPTSAEQARLELYRKPNAYFEERLKNPPEIVDGQRLHPKIQHYQEQRGRQKEAEDANNAWWDQFLIDSKRTQARRAVDRTWTYRSKITEAMAKVEDRKVRGPGGDIPVRIYTPKTSQQGLLPVLVYYHGGGWLMGSVEAADRAVRLLANEADVIVVSADYRLAPEYKLPAPQDDAQAVFQWTQTNAPSFGGDPTRVGVGGDSAGGQLATVTSLRQWEEGKIVPAWQLLYYPVTDMRYNYSSFDKFHDGYGLNRHFMDKMVELALPPGIDLDDPHISPIRAKDLSGLPPTIIVTAGFDVLRDQGRALAERLSSQGVPVIYRNYGSLTHGFMQHSETIDEAERACVESAQLLGSGLRGRYRGSYY